uniref:Uncharacterized protein n=1 Tax=Arundo donax TaxID=35708 RepID=A0A0A8YK54_ARUDO
MSITTIKMNMWTAAEYSTPNRRQGTVGTNEI